jgi:aerobic-type carbon monoxide dehydrogenase small subunit (CoxS/CutS family)
VRRGTLRLADHAHVVEADETRSLLDVLRAELGVRSASRGCQDGSCGACRVIVDGALVSSCGVAWGALADGARVETYEELASEEAARRVVDAFEAERPTRCRMCVGALGVTAIAVARAGTSAAARETAIEDALAAATCMCTGRGSWRRALLAGASSASGARPGESSESSESK